MHKCKTALAAYNIGLQLDLGKNTKLAHLTGSEPAVFLLSGII